MGLKIWFLLGSKVSGFEYFVHIIQVFCSIASRCMPPLPLLRGKWLSFTVPVFMKWMSSLWQVNPLRIHLRKTPSRNHFTKKKARISHKLLQEKPPSREQVASRFPSTNSQSQLSITVHDTKEIAQNGVTTRKKCFQLLMSSLTQNILGSFSCQVGSPKFALMRTFLAQQWYIKTVLKDAECTRLPASTQ